MTGFVNLFFWQAEILISTICESVKAGSPNRKISDIRIIQRISSMISELERPRISVKTVWRIMGFCTRT